MKNKFTIFFTLIAIFSTFFVFPLNAGAVRIDYGEDGSIVRWSLNDDGLLRIYGTGKMLSLNHAEVPWYSQREEIKSVVVEDGITKIGNAAFYECINLTSVQIAESVTIIGTHVFYKCSSLTSLNMPGNLTSVDEYAFAECENLKSVSLNEGLKTIGNYCFNNDINLTDITLPSTLTKLNFQAFKNCSSLEKITIPLNVTSIYSNTFNGCKSLKSITMHDNITSIDSSAFYGCTSLEKIRLPKKITKLESSTFRKCTSLKSIDVPEGVTSINMNCFTGCTSLERLDLPSSLTFINSYPWDNTPALKDIYYAGSKSDWKEIDFADYAYVPSYTTLHYNAMTRDVSSEVELNGEQTVVSATVKNTTGQPIVGSVYSALYSEDGKFLGVGATSVELETDDEQEINVKINTAAQVGNELKTFLWGSCSPLSKSDALTIY